MRNLVAKSFRYNKTPGMITHNSDTLPAIKKTRENLGAGK